MSTPLPSGRGAGGEGARLPFPNGVTAGDRPGPRFPSGGFGPPHPNPLPEGRGSGERRPDRPCERRASHPCFSLSGRDSPFTAPGCVVTINFQLSRETGPPARFSFLIASPPMSEFGRLVPRGGGDEIPL